MAPSNGGKPPDRTAPTASVLARSTCFGLDIEQKEIAHHVFEAGSVEMGLDPGCLDTGMAERLLQHVQINTA